MRASVKGHYSWAIDKLRHKQGYLYKEKKIFNITFVFIFLLKKYVKSTKQKSELYKAVLYLPKEVNSFYIKKPREMLFGEFIGYACSVQTFLDGA